MAHKSADLGTTGAVTLYRPPVTFTLRARKRDAPCDSWKPEKIVLTKISKKSLKKCQPPVGTPAEARSRYPHCPTASLINRGRFMKPER